MVLLVGEQPIPNLLPVRHYKPKGVILVYSERTERIAKNLQDVLKPHLCIMCKVRPYEVDELQANLKTVFRDKHWKGPDLIFNLTGGTKPMMLAAYSVAQELGSQCLYLISEKGTSEVRRYQFRDGALRPSGREIIPATISLDDYLRLHVGEYEEQRPKDAFELAVMGALRGCEAIDELRTDVRPQSAHNLEIDLLVRRGNQVGLAEIKRKADKSAIDQLTTAASREYLGTYTHKFLIAANKLSSGNRRLAQVQAITVIELLSFSEHGQLSEADIQRLRHQITMRLGVG